MSGKMAPKPVYDLSSLNVMIVDDSYHMLQIVRTLLAAMNIRNMRSVDNPEEAFAELRAKPPELLIVDWNMIPFDGLAFVRRIRRDQECGCVDVPILLLTAHTELERVLEARDAGVNRVMAKPVSFRTLYDNMIAAIYDPRPFVSTADYVGPDRRFRPAAGVSAERRKTSDKKIS
ncbi:MAG TPA: response regulator [Dongiaceae bacterium]|nr:response regulator [Dongiaceae bacterium]